jgi:prepilin-type N-terminal cleavage/methylation domain-containing protein
MKRNQNGFTIIELLVVLVMTSIVLVPLLISFTDSIIINRQAMQKRIAVSLAEGIQYSIEKIKFADYRTFLDDSYAANNDYLELDDSDCDSLFTSTSDQNICHAIFTMESANMVCDDTKCQLYLFDYDFNGQYDSLLSDTSLPAGVRNSLQTNQDILAEQSNPINTENLIWMVLWINYYDDPQLNLTTVGIIANDDPQ